MERICTMTEPPEWVTVDFEDDTKGTEVSLGTGWSAVQFDVSQLAEPGFHERMKVFVDSLPEYVPPRPLNDIELAEDYRRADEPYTHFTVDVDGYIWINHEPETPSEGNAKRWWEWYQELHDLATALCEMRDQREWGTLTSEERWVYFEEAAMSWEQADPEAEARYTDYEEGY
jgi:hypothetical protein